MKKTIQIIIEIAFISGIIVAVFVAKLYQNIAGGPTSAERVFSKENVLETLLIVVVVSAVVVPVHIYIKRGKSDETSE